jgi:hypothetical protein
MASGIAAMSSTKIGSTLHPAMRKARANIAAVSNHDGRFTGGIDLAQQHRESAGLTLRRNLQSSRACR